MRRVVLWTLLVALVLALLVAASHDRESVLGRLSNEDFASLIALLLVLGYTYRFDLRDISDRVLAELIPGRTFGRARTVELVRGNGGDFQISTEVNGKHVAMVLDTGASTVVLTND